MECYIIIGEVDFLIKIVCKDILIYEKFLFKIFLQIDEIECFKMFMIFFIVKDVKVLFYCYE